MYIHIKAFTCINMCASEKQVTSHAHSKTRKRKSNKAELMQSLVFAT